ncbi:MAG TPA: nodulation protein NfeD [Nitrospiraceae bacterium]|nr:nodulation protein NfeD [Nitrospiraceae bacterium]
MRGRSYTREARSAAAAYFLVLVWGLFPPAAASAEDAAEVVVAVYEGVINPVAAEYLHDAIITAQERKSRALIVRLDTPGGLDTSMRLIIKDITGASVPVVVYVSPSGGRAASAGVFITMAAHVAAMAPGTNIGAAHPVAMGGGDMDKTMREKVENDSAAYIKSIAEQRGRNAVWAENAVRKSVSATEKEAMKLKVVDGVADDLPALLKWINGRTVSLAGGPVTLRTDSVVLYDYPMSLRLELLKTLSDPNIAYILMTVGTIGLMAELYNPGAILPGIVGAISLILAFYSFQSLPVNYAGLLLMALGILFFILEASVASYGLLAIGGVISMLLGSLMLIKTDAEFYQLSWGVILPVIGLAAVFSLFIVGMGVRAMRQPPQTGVEGMVGLIGVVRTAVAPHGQVSVHGELWGAVSDQPLQPGDRAEVTRVEGLTLHVRPVSRKDEAVS